MSFNISRTGTHEVKLPCLCGITCVTQVEVYERSYVEFLETENVRLRTALNQIVSILDCVPKDKEHSSILNDTAFGVARAALENK